MNSFLFKNPVLSIFVFSAIVSALILLASIASDMKSEEEIYIQCYSHTGDMIYQDSGTVRISKLKYTMKNMNTIEYKSNKTNKITIAPSENCFITYTKK